MLFRSHFAGAREDENPNRLDSLGGVTVRFDLRLDSAVHRGHHGVALFTANRELLWAKAMDGLRLQPGLHTISYTFPCLPLRPGPYFWQVSLWEEGKLLDAWDCLPEMIVSTPNLQHARDEWNGVLNLPCEAVVTEGEGVEVA